VSSVARKPLSIAFEEIAAEKIVKIERLPYDEMEAEADEIFGAESEFNDSDADESDAE
jgi:hypothetical protein